MRGEDPCDTLASMAHSDALMIRGELALVENRLLRMELRRLRMERHAACELLRHRIGECASQRAEFDCTRQEIACRGHASAHLLRACKSLRPRGS
jgi:hypothetical protein